MRVLVVEDEVKMAALVRRGLEREGYAVDVAADGPEALWSARERDYDAIVLDAMIPEPDGFAVCRTLRDEGRWAPVLILTARDSVEDRVRGLDAGADDYLTKPFAFEELFARLRALTRRGPVERPIVLVVGDLTLDPVTRTVRRGDQRVDLSAKEFALLEFLMRHPDEVLTRTRIIEHVWDFAYEGGSNVVDVYVRYLREKVDRPFGRADIETVRGVGYRLRSEVDLDAGGPERPRPGVVRTLAPCASCRPRCAADWPCCSRWGRPPCSSSSPSPSTTCSTASCSRRSTEGLHSRAGDLAVVASQHGQLPDRDPFAQVLTPRRPGRGPGAGTARRGPYPVLTRASSPPSAAAATSRATSASSAATASCWPPRSRSAAPRWCSSSGRRSTATSGPANAWRWCCSWPAPCSSGCWPAAGGCSPAPPCDRCGA